MKTFKQYAINKNYQTLAETLVEAEIDANLFCKNIVEIAKEEELNEQFWRKVGDVASGIMGGLGGMTQAYSSGKEEVMKKRNIEYAQASVDKMGKELENIGIDVNMIDKLIPWIKNSITKEMEKTGTGFRLKRKAQSQQGQSSQPVQPQSQSSQPQRSPYFSASTRQAV